MTETIAQPEAEFSPERLAEIEAEAEAIDPGPARTDSERTLYRYLRARSAGESEIARLRAATDEMIRGLESSVKALDYVYMSRAKQIVQEMLAGKKVKSVKTPFGTVGFRTSPERIEVLDDDALIHAAESKLEYMGLVRQKTEVSRTAVAEYFKATGDLPPGCDVKAAEEKFYVKG